MAANMVKLGDQFAEKGTTAWADWQRSLLKNAVKHVHFEARDIVQVIRDMCQGEAPAWHLMTRRDGVGFRTFEEFVTTPQPEGLGFPNYQRFRGIAVSEPGIMTEREYDLLTAAPALKLKRADDSDIRPSRTSEVGKDKAVWLRSIARADPFIRELFVRDLIDLKLAAKMGRDDPKVDKALTAVRAVERNGDDKKYRQAVNKAIRQVLGKQPPSPLDRVKSAIGRLTPAERARLIRWLEGQE